MAREKKKKTEHVSLSAHKEANHKQYNITTVGLNRGCFIPQETFLVAAIWRAGDVTGL